MCHSPCDQPAPELAPRAEDAKPLSKPYSLIPKVEPHTVPAPEPQGSGRQESEDPRQASEGLDSGASNARQRRGGLVLEPDID